MLTTYAPTLCQKGHGPYVHIGQSDYLGEYHEFDWFCPGYDYVDDYGNAHYVECNASESLPYFYINEADYRGPYFPIPANESSWDNEVSPWYYEPLYWTDGTF